MNRTTLAIIYSLLAIVFFDLMGLIIKRLSSDYGAAELSAWRNLFGLVPTTLVLLWSADWHRKGRQLKVRQWRLAVFRGVLLTFAQFSFYLSLGILSFATATTITYANALFLVTLAVPLLGERVGWIRWSAVLVGFCGVILVVGPGRDSFSSAALLPLFAAFCYALVGVTARMMDDDVPTALINLYSSIIAGIGAVVLVLFLGGFSAFAQGSDILWIAGMGGFGGIAVLFMVTAFRMADQSDLAPFSYFGIPIAFGLGWVFYGEAPWRDLFPGAVLIIAGGLLVIWRERQLRQSERAENGT